MGPLPPSVTSDSKGLHIVHTKVPALSIETSVKQVAVGGMVGDRGPRVPLRGHAGAAGAAGDHGKIP